MDQNAYDLICRDILDFIYDEDTINQKMTIDEKNNLIFLFKQTFQNNQKQEQTENEELIKEYYIFLKKIQELIDFLNLHYSELEKALIIEYLLYKNYLSLSRYKNKDTFTLPYHSGINVIAGYGVCRHKANFFNDIISSNHHELLAGFITKNLPLNVHKPTNHLINLVYYHDTLYGFDLANRTLWTFINGLQLKDIQRKNIYLTYRSFNDLVCTNLSISDIKKQLNLYQESAERNHLTKEEYQALKCSLFEKLNARKKVLNSFYYDNQKIIQSIHDKVLLKNLNQQNG